MPHTCAHGARGEWPCCSTAPYQIPWNRVCVRVRVSVCVCYVCVSLETRDTGSPEAGDTDSCKLSKVSARNQSPFLWERQQTDLVSEPSLQPIISPYSFEIEFFTEPGAILLSLLPTASHYGSTCHHIQVFNVGFRFQTQAMCLRNKCH